MTLFDTYVAVDWSARSVPKCGKDSVWLCVHGAAPENPPTRAAATERVRSVLRAGARTLVGFDFPYAYPAGFADLAAPGEGSGWRRVWRLLAGLIEDDERNRNNRFEIAAELNRRLATTAPFWGCDVERPGLTRTRAPRFPVRGFAEFRTTDRAVRGVQSPWKLWGNGSVGSQMLLGIPRLAALRDDPELAPVSAVWPFEPLEAARVVHVEIWPGLVEPEPGYAVRDAAQVAAVARHFAELDADGRLGQVLSAAPPVAREEGWIFGAAA